MNDAHPAAVIFDLDGTLIDSLPGIEFSVKTAFAVCGIPFPAVNLRSVIGPPIRSILAGAANMTESSKLTELENAFRRSYDRDGWRKTTCYPKVKSVLRLLRDAGQRLFVVTNKPREISLRILINFGIAQIFDAIVTRDMRIPGYLNKQEMIEFLLDSHTLDRETCILIGDTQEDANAAASCGIRFAFASYGYGTISDTSIVPVHYTVDNFSQLLQLLSPEFAHDR